MRYDFDTPINRRNTFSFKWDCDMDYFGRDDVIPMWVADMDFACAPCIVEAVQKRAAHPVYGYGVRQQPYYDAVMGWLKKRHGFEVNYEHLAFAPPGVIYAMNVMLRILTKPGDRVMVPMPNYDPLFDMVTRGGRKLVETPLVWKDGRYTFDFADMEAKAASGVKVLVLSSPHNPTGRVWTRQELEGVAEICLRHNIFMLVDEIHCDFVPPEHPHTTFGLLGEEVLRIFADIGCRSVFTTHIPELALLPERLNTSEVNSRLTSLVALCDENGAPTYRIAPGTPDRARNAQYIFGKFGISFEEYSRAKMHREQP